MKKILVVDDQRQVRALVEATLQIGDYEILQASSGDQALAIARAVRPDVVLLDVMMPDSPLDGFEVCRQLRSDPTMENMTIIMLTALDQATNIEKGKQAGANDYLIKPFSPLQLMNKIDDLLS